MSPCLPAASRWAVVVLATGCSAVVDVRSLATGRTDVSAYELRGPELTMLHREARRLCPQGGEVMRQSGRDQRTANDDGSLRRWMNATSAVLDPPKRQSQLVVVCKESADTPWATATAPAIDAVVATAPATAPANVPANVPANAPAPAPVPLAPIAVEW